MNTNLRDKHFDETTAYLKAIECSKPTKAGMYLALIHGRSDPDQDMDYWGETGPCFGPLSYAHITYNQSINIGAYGVEDGTGPMFNGDPMHFHSDMLYYDGMYYGDWEMFYHDGSDT